MTKKTLANMQVRIGGDTKELESSFKKAQKQFNTFKVGMAAIAATTSAAIAGTIALTNKAADYADQIDKSSIRTGLARDTIQSLAYVADQAGLGFDKVEDSLKDVTISMGNALAGTKAQVDAYKQLGIEVTDSNGRLRKVADVYPEVISKLSEMTNEAERNVLGTKLMGESAIEVVPKLSALGKDGLQQLIDKSKDLNLVMGNDSIATLVAYKDGMATLKGQFTATMNQATVPFANIMSQKVLPALSKTLDKVADWVRTPMSESLREQQTELNLLVRSLMAANDLEDTRNRIIGEINSKYPKFLGGIDTEKRGLDDIQKRLKLVNEQYRDRIRLLIIEEDVAAKEEVKALYRVQEEEIKKLTKTFQIYADQSKLTNTWHDAKTYQEMIAELKKSGKYFWDVAKAAETFENRFRKIGSDITKIEKEYEELLGKRISFENVIASKLEEQGDLLGLGKDSVTEIAKKLDGIAETKTVTVTVKMKQDKQSAVPVLNTTADPSSILSQLDEAFAITREKTQAQIDEMNGMIEAGVEGMVSSFAQGLGQLMTGDIGLDGFLKGLLSQFGQFMVQMGEMLIAYGIAMDAFKKAFSNPFIAIAAGAALVAIGSAIASMASSGPSSSGAQSNETTFDTRRLSTANLGTPNMSAAAVPYNGNTAEMKVNVSIKGKIGHDAIYLSNKQGEKTVKARG